MRHPSHEEALLLQKATKFLPEGSLGNVALDPDHSFIVKRGSGSRIWDVSGNEYIDYLMGSGPMVLGHAHPSVVQAVIKAVQEGSTFFAINEYAVLLAEELVRAVPCADKVRFTTSGTDACFQALRIARAFRRRDKILKFEGGFHGTSDYSLMSNPPRALHPFPQPDPSSGGIPKALLDTVLIAPFNDAETTTAIIEQNHDDLAAVIIEPMQRILSPKPGFLQALREVTAHYQIPLIFDEVVTGFRLAYGGAQEYYGVTPDLTAVGKIMGGGYALAAVCGREEIMAPYDSSQVDAGDHVGQIGTLNGNPVACAAGLATLAELRKEGAYERIWSTGRRAPRRLGQPLRSGRNPRPDHRRRPRFRHHLHQRPPLRLPLHPVRRQRHQSPFPQPHPGAGNLPGPPEILPLPRPHRRRRRPDHPGLRNRHPQPPTLTPIMERTPNLPT